MAYGLKINDSSGNEVLTLANSTGLIIAQYNYGPFTATGDYFYNETNANFINCQALIIPTRTRMLTNVSTSFSGTTLNVYIHTTAAGNSPFDTYVAIYVIDKGAL